MTLFQALYGRRCRTPLCRYDSGESVMLGPEIIQQTTEKIKIIQEKMKASQTLQKSYHDKKRKSLKFQEGDYVFLRVTLVTGVGCGWSLRSLRRVSLVCIIFSNEYERQPTELCYHHIFRIFMMCFMYLSLGSTFMIYLMWSSWIVCQLERTWQLKLYRWGLRIVKWNACEARRSFQWRLFREVILVAVWHGSSRVGWENLIQSFSRQ